jgi:hypothetical protein
MSKVVKITCDNGWPMYGNIVLETYWHRFFFGWDLQVQLWYWDSVSLCLGPMQFSHVDLGEIAAMEAVYHMKWTSRYVDE